MRICLTIAVTSISLIGVTACSLQFTDGYHFHFRALDDPRLARQTAKIEVPALSEEFFQEAAAGNLGVFFARFRGSLLQLFGKALSESTDSDEAFQYVIEASTADGQTVILTAYGGSSGPAIGGNSELLLTQQAAEVLFEHCEMNEHFKPASAERKRSLFLGKCCALRNILFTHISSRLCRLPLCGTPVWRMAQTGQQQPTSSTANTMLLQTETALHPGTSLRRISTMKRMEIA